MKFRAIQSINVVLQMLLVIFLNVSLIVLSIISLIGGDFTMFIVLLALSYILVHTAMTRISRGVISLVSKPSPVDE